jgi:signal transduction histidine kinase
MSDLTSRTLWYIKLRWFILLLVITPSLIASYLDVGWGTRFLRDVLFCSTILASNGIFNILAYTVKKRSTKRILAYVLTLFDVVFITFFIYIKGGIESRSVVLYILPIIASAAILGRKGTYLSTAVAIVTYTFVILGGFEHWLGTPLSMYTPALDRDPGYVGNTIVFFDLVLAMAGTGIDYMTKLLIHKQREATEALANLKRTQLIAKVGSWEYIAATQKVIYSDELFAVLRRVLPSRTLSADGMGPLIHPDDRTLVRRKFRTVLRKLGSFSFEYRMVSPEGAIQYIHLDGQSVAGHDGSIERIVGSARDVTEERSLEKARYDFVALASHQLRTPATIVKQYIAMLKDGYAGAITDDQSKYLRIAYDNNERQIKIVNDLLNVARIDSNAFHIRPQRVDLAALLQNIIRDQTAKFTDKSQPLTLATHYADLPAFIDADSLRMAIENLLDNAHKYTPEGKRVRVKLVKKARSAIISITDSGVGIDKSDVPKLFKMFSRVDNPLTMQQEGTGLGLYWAARIIKLHKGKITVNSQPGKGTTFSILLPLGPVKER